MMSADQRATSNLDQAAWLERMQPFATRILLAVWHKCPDRAASILQEMLDQRTATQLQTLSVDPHDPLMIPLAECEELSIEACNALDEHFGVLYVRDLLELTWPQIARIPYRGPRAIIEVEVLLKRLAPLLLEGQSPLVSHKKDHR